jgi:hypothetical protein
MRTGTRALSLGIAFVASTLIAPCPDVLAADAPEVTIRNYVRAETDLQMRTYVQNMDAFGKFAHVREAYDVTSRDTVRPNRDTIYSWSVFDLTSPLTIVLPDPKGRYQSLMIVSQDHYTWAEYGPKEVVLDEEAVGTRYALLLVRTFLDPNDEADVKAAHALQDAIIVKQADKGEFEYAGWDKEEVEAMREKINVVGAALPPTGTCFGRKEELDPIYWLLCAAYGWGGLPPKDSTYTGGVPEKNDGNTPYILTVKDVPVDAFWSVTVYDDKGMFIVNDLDAYSYSSVTAQKSEDGSVTIHFGGDPRQTNFLPIAPGWNYIVRMYRPRQEILDGTWRFPVPEPVKN